jgi:polar amino acid transport system substrate-binding protein
VHRKDLNFDWQTLGDLRPYRVAMVRDYTYTPALWSMAKAGELKVENLPDDLSALKLLLLGRIDLAPMERNVACDLLRRNFSTKDAARLMAHPKLMTDTFTTHLMLPRKRPENSARMQSFNQGLKHLKDTGRHAQLLSQLSCPTGWGMGKK